MTRLINQYCHLLNQELRKIRRNIGSYSLKRFARVYLSNICNKRFSRMHRLIFANLMLFTKNRRARIAIAAPRGHAKSTIVSLVY
ncbi:MAG: hypothetical protein ACYTEE_10480, partial [Planctomycetota bacterium]